MENWFARLHLPRLHLPRLHLPTVASDAFAERRSAELFAKACTRPIMKHVLPFVLLFLAVNVVHENSALGQSQLSQLTLKNGMKFEGRYSETGKISRDLSKIESGASKTNVIIDDGLRRIFFPKRNLQSVIPTNQRTVIKIKRPPSRATKRYLGSVLKATPFDEHGRRTVALQGGLRATQEIIEISPIYTRLQSPNYKWDMRIGTNSIPADQLQKVILTEAKRTGKDPAETYLELVRLLSMSERYAEAAAVLKGALDQFPELKEQNLEPLLQAYVQEYIDRILTEITRLRRGGQHDQAQYLLKGLDNTAAGTESLIQANEMLAGYEKSSRQGKRVIEELAPLVEATDDGDEPRLKMIKLLYEEIKNDLNYNNLPRMASFLNLASGTGLSKDEKLAIGISGWLLGQGDDIRNLKVAASLLEVRNLVREYLRAMGPGNRAVREELLAKIKDREGGTPEYVTQLLKNMKPPHDLPAPTAIAGMHEVSVPNTHPDFPVNYTVQLPPEYDPYHRYPVIVSLHSTSGKPAMQIGWWCGDYNEAQQRRAGQATRHGYIVIAPKWTKGKQRRYEYSAREHDIVLKSLRDASRRFSIDSDRVFISGHASGGDAAWDIALAHPDLWAGMVLIGARGGYGQSSPQYVTFYSPNAKHFPLYMVLGRLDGDKWRENSIHFNKYMKPGYDPVLVQYQGRGNEHFYEEIQRIFEWLELHQRRPIPKKFEAKSMRNSDNFFWFAEFERFPTRTVTNEFAWPVKKPAAADIEGAIGANNTLRIKSGADRTTVWLSPEIVDFDKRIQVTIDGKKFRQTASSDQFDPKLEVILEDARQRADRQHVFWAKISNR